MILEVFWRDGATGARLFQRAYQLSATHLEHLSVGLIALDEVLRPVAASVTDDNPLPGMLKAALAGELGRLHATAAKAEPVPSPRTHPLYPNAELCPAELELRQDGAVVRVPCEKLAHDDNQRHEWWLGRVVGSPYAEVWWWGNNGCTSFDVKASA